MKPGSHSTLFEDIAGLRHGGPLDRLERTRPDGRRYLYEWVTEQTIEELVRGARSRWKIENETFNTLRSLIVRLATNPCRQTGRRELPAP